tara:strand:+ start:5261 stop:5458 length:198 start_codon:yes stop_codon:yes gene_type:complete
MLDPEDLYIGTLQNQMSIIGSNSKYGKILGLLKILTAAKRGKSLKAGIRAIGNQTKMISLKSFCI